MSGDDKCRDCRHWGAIEGSGDPITGVAYGLCHKRPPVVLAIDDYAETHWPETYGSNWCGEHEAGKSGRNRCGQKKLLQIKDLKDSTGLRGNGAHPAPSIVRQFHHGAPFRKKSS